MRLFIPFKPTARERRTQRAHSERLEARTLLTTFNVNSLIDTVDTNPGDGVAVDADGNTSLRAAVQEANALAGEDTIVLPAAVDPVQLFIAGRGEDMAATGDLDITDDVTIIGAGSGATIVDIERLDRVFDIHPGVTAELSGMTIRDARVNSSTEDGGAIRNRGTLRILDSTLTLNDSAGGGGAILNEAGATLTVVRSRLDQNTASGVRGGGALLNRGTATIDRSVLDRNTGSVAGGGVFNAGTGDLTVIGTELTSNRTNSGQNGAGLFNVGIADVSHSTFHLNQATNGAAIYVSGGGNAELRLTNSTLSGNFAFGRGGGVYVADQNDDVLIRLSTVTENFAAAAGGGLFTVGDIGLSGSIVAGNSTSGFLSVSQVSGAISSNGFNLLGTAVTGQTVDDIVEPDPVLDSLERNGGPTRTHRPLSGSPAVDNGHPSDTSTLDQRFLTRPRDVSGGPGAPDIGAYEVQPFVYSPDLTDLRVRLNGQDLEIINETDGTVVQTTPFHPDIEIIITGTDGDDSLIVDFSGGDPVPVDGLTFDGADGSDSLTLTDAVFTTITHTYLNATDVDIALDDGSSVRVVSGIGLSNLTDGLSATGRVFDFGVGNDEVVLDDDGLVGNAGMRFTSGLTIPLVDFRNPDSTLVLNLGDGDDDLTLAGVDADYAGSLTATAGIGDDRLDAAALTTGTNLQGNAGADTLTGGSGDDTLNGNSGSDSLLGGDGNDRILGGSDRDVLIGGAGDDELRGQGSIDDSLTGGLGDDVLDGGNNDGSGNDVLIERHNVPDLTLTETSLTGLGNDTLVGIRKAYLRGGAAANRMDASAFPFFALLLGAGGGDELIGGAGRNILIGGPGNDTLTGNGGNDRLRGGGRHDVLSGGDGADVVLGHRGRDTLTGGQGNDRLIGGPGIDLLVESADADVTVTRTRLVGIGTDALRQLDRLKLTGGPGDNRLDVSQFGRPTIVEGLDGNDTIIGSAVTDALSGGDGDDSILGRGGNDRIFGGNGNDILNGGDGNDVIDAGAGNDGLSGGTGSDQLLGGDDSDTLYGGDGDDALSGGSGDDTVQGGLGDDAVNGDAGTDVLTGGIGDGVAQGGDIFDTPGESDEFFSLNPVPDWVDQE